MRIPRGCRTQTLRDKVCKEPGCGKAFTGFPARKFCDIHVDAKTRAKKAGAVSDHSKNAYIKHSYTNDVLIEIGCRDCGKEFRLRLRPKQYIYPGVCESCRHHNKEIV